MNATLKTILQRRSVRRYRPRPIPRKQVDQILAAAMRAPTAGNMMLYSIIEVDDARLKQTLAGTCDNQAFIARAPLVLVFLADYCRWMDYYAASGISSAWCREQGLPLRTPGEGELLLACCDALIAAQTAVLAAESMGIGSCYIGDIMENFERHAELLALPRYVFPVAMLCFGYPADSATEKKALSPRFPRESLYFHNRYHRRNGESLRNLFADRELSGYPPGVANFGQHMYRRKFAAPFSIEMSRSVAAAIRHWSGVDPQAVET
jgi:nitroreductase